MTARTRALYSFCALIACGAPGCNWSSLWGLDAPRPSISPSDYFVVDPPCPDLIIDPSAIALVPRIVTITGRRKDTAIGAEGVPVTVRRGACTSELSEGATAGNKAVADGGAGASGDAGRERDVGAAADGGGVGATDDAGTKSDAGSGADAPSCTEGKRALSEAFTDGVELDALEGRGCRQRSPSLLECTLNPRGEATFEVIGHFGGDVVSFDGYVPICVTPLEVVDDGGTRAQQKTVYVVPRYGSARYALSVVNTSDSPAAPGPPLPAPGPVADCGSLHGCEQKRMRGGYFAGLAPSDVPAADVRPSDLLANMSPKSVWLKVEVSPSGAVSETNPLLSPNAGCPEADSKPSLTLELPPQRKTTDPFFVCASGFASPSVSIVALATSKDSDAGGDTSDPSPLAGVRSNPRAVPLAALLSGYEAHYLGEPDVFVNALFCGALPQPAVPGAVRVVGVKQAPRNDRLAITCSNDDDGGAAERGGSPTNSDIPPECRLPVTLEAMGETCQLTISK